MNVFIIQTIIMVILAFIIFYLIIYNKTLNLERRISKYSVESIKDNSISLFDILSINYNKLINKITKVLKRSHILTKYSSKYNKYISYDNIKEVCAMDYVSNKVFIFVLFIFIISFARIIEGIMPSFIDILIAGLVGFFSLDIYFIFSDMIKKRLVEQELLNAIIIMNNAFRSGRSTIQAIEIVAQELKGPIKQEFRKMHLEITYGLSLDVVFERFGKRVESDEVKYITSSLSILNKTGGNIIKVFSSVEKMLFNKRKLKQEMNSLTSSSKMLGIFLLLMPIIFVAVVSFISLGINVSAILKDPIAIIKLFFTESYFAPLFITTIGNILLGLIIIIYASYALAIKKALKVRI